MSFVSRVRALSPTTILAIGWLGLVLYAFPGHMSFDSAAQLIESRGGSYTDAHPPAMAALWRLVEVFVSGPVGILLIQTTTLLAGAYLLLKRRMSPRAAAVTTSLLLWFPVVSNTMSTIWKDSLMSAFLLLGTALLLSERRNVRIGGLAFLAAATAMRHNAFAMTLPLVVLLFVWNPAYAWWRRYAIAFAAWIVVTGSAQFVNRALTRHELHLWHQSLAELDIVGTLQYVDDIPDAELHRILDGTGAVLTDHQHAKLRVARAPDVDVVAQLWVVTDALFARPRPPKLGLRWPDVQTPAQRDAMARAWKEVVPTHLSAYLHYRWDVFRQLMQMTEVPVGSAAYLWFNDIQDIDDSAYKIGHDASYSGIQRPLHDAMWWLGSTVLFNVYVYVLLAIALLPWCLRDREVLGLVASGLVGSAGLFVVAPTTDFRYMFWLVLCALLGLIMTVTRQIAWVTASTMKQ
ncbi:MAG TPA: hypothetical protein VFV99_06515 [Kofleriaceae bacterium]|nr:hypothetical protein [Kofleriaceae bacterium]